MVVTENEKKLLSYEDLMKIEEKGKSLKIAFFIIIIPLFIGIATWLTLAGIWATQNSKTSPQEEKPNPYIWPFFDYKRDPVQAPPYAVVDTNDVI